MTEWWRGAVIYQIYPRSFADANGDGIGDLPGVIERLDYIASLGVDAIWLSPFFTSPMKDFGYDVADYCDVDPIFGCLDDFDRLLEGAHARGLKLIIDQVWSHSSDRHPWFLESRASRDNPKADWYVWADAKPDGGPPNNWQSLFIGPAWSWDGRRKQYYCHNFLSAQPDLNLQNPQVQDAVLDTARFWLDRGVDGFRLDATNFYMQDRELRDNPPAAHPKGLRPYDFQQHLYNRSRPENLAFIERIRALLDSYPDRFSVAEIGDNSSIAELISYVEGAGRLHSAYSFVFIETQDLNGRLIREAVNDWAAADPAAWPSWAFSNHDAPRVASRWNGAGDADPRFVMMLNALLVSLRGTAFIYQGQELGLPQAQLDFDDLRDPEAIANWPETLGRDGARTPMPWTHDADWGGFSRVAPWLTLDERHRKLAVDLQDQDSDSPLNHFRALLALRRRHKALSAGALHFCDAPEPVIAFERHHASGQLLCAFNLAPEPIRWSPRSNKGWTQIGLPGVEGGFRHGEVEMPGYGGALLKAAWPAN